MLTGREDLSIPFLPKSDALNLLSFLKGFKFVGVFFRSGHKMEKDVLGGTKAVSLALEWTVW